MSKLDDWRAGRARPDTVKTVTFERVDYVKERRGESVRVHKNFGLPKNGEVTFKNDGRCPCKGECGHDFMYECEEADCKCCTATCN